MTVQKENKHNHTKSPRADRLKTKKTANYIYLKRIRKGAMLVDLKREKVGALCI